MKVTLISHTPDPEKTIACAAKLCYSPSTISTLYDGLTEEKAADFVGMLAEMAMKARLNMQVLLLELKESPARFLLRLPDIELLLTVSRVRGMFAKKSLNL